MLKKSETLLILEPDLLWISGIIQVINLLLDFSELSCYPFCASPVCCHIFHVMRAKSVRGRSRTFVKSYFLVYSAKVLMFV